MALFNIVQGLISTIMNAAVIENAFVKSYQLLCSDQHEVVSEFLQKVEDLI